ncbi:P1 family peptidase [Brevibacterium litoralis]|uniref:P1 family peptidase n=1 Tax=Brevibacterium litoralis TaxID=3138935 RepID=UPI0032EE718F
MPHLPLGTLRRGAGVTEVPGVRLGHHTRDTDGALTGVTVIVPPPGTMAAVDVRGGGPAGHETGVIEPGTHPYGADAIVLTGGSAHGLVTTHGVMEGLMADGRGFPAPGAAGAAGVTVPIVPAAALFDLGRGTAPFAPPLAAHGLAAYRAAAEAPSPAPGNVSGHALGHASGLRGSLGAGTGAWTGRGLTRGGLGQAALTTPTGHTVAAVVAVNAMGSLLDPTGRFHAGTVLAQYGYAPGDAPGISGRWEELDRAAEETARREDQGASGAGADGARNTTIACLVTDAALDSAQTQRLAASAHAGLARAVHPSHTLYDGDTVFALSTQASPIAPGDLPEVLVGLNIAAADVLTAAMVDAVFSATPSGVPGAPPALGELAPEAAAAWAALP